MRAEVIRIPTGGPADISGLTKLADLGIDPAKVRAVIGKTEGNGCVNDFSRDLAARAWTEAVGGEVLTVMSGGTEGVLSPHVTLLVNCDDDPGAPVGALAIGVNQSRVIEPEHLGRRAQVEAVRDSVIDACQAALIPLEEVELALVKCPLLTTGDTYGSMGRSRAASALGIGLALGEIRDDQIEAALAGNFEIWSSVASASSGIEVNSCHVVILGHSAHARGRLRASHTVMKDAIDAESVMKVLADIRERGGEIVQVFAKAEPDPTGSIRGRRHTMLTDSDLAPTRHARAAVAGLLAGLVGETAIYVSGGAEHQGPPGGGPVTIVWRLPS